MPVRSIDGSRSGQSSSLDGVQQIIAYYVAAVQKGVMSKEFMFVGVGTGGRDPSYGERLANLLLA